MSDKRLVDMTEPELHECMMRAARAIEAELPHGCGPGNKALFCLLVFEDAPGIAQYISNCQRQDTIKAMREVADRLEGGEDIPR